MCNTCGCNDHENLISIGHPANFSPHQSKGAISLAPSSISNDIRIAQDVLGSNDLIASKTRAFLQEKGILSLNMVGSPGSGKTSLIVKTIEALASEMAIYVIEGDQYGSLDADKISATGTPVLQINTGNGCHLDAESVSRAIQTLVPASHSLLIIENVGNLVCPALFDLGEHKRVVIFSVTEGDDKPVKYAPMFHGSAVCLISKTDLLNYVDFNLKLASDNLKKINHHIQTIPLSASSGEGLNDWFEMIRRELNLLKSQKRDTHPAQ